MINYNVNASNYASQANTNLKFVKGSLNVIFQIDVQCLTAKEFDKFWQKHNETYVQESDPDLLSSFLKNKE
ncbi:hypothetical protein V1478_011675 [Vespula squamosa]|uniref:Uncharacterized protein n=1 Tax=Vespula squamosa TaxID=30214 RepID=A0ABD2AFT4_VESSQ